MKRLRLIAVITIVLLLGWLMIYLAQPSEPSYQGRTLSNWLEAFQAADMDTATNGGEIHQATEHAIKEMGTNVIPILLEWLQATDSPMKVRVNKILDRQDYIQFRFQPAYQRQIMAIQGFAFLGNDAKTALPTLVQLLQGPDHHQRFRAMECFLVIDMYQHNMLPEILQMLQNSDPRVQNKTASYLNSHYPEEAEKAGVYQMFPEMKRTPTNVASNISPPPNK